ncbi:hypothetical protein KIL84_021011 [Mauremys mutica]|uniref:Uncharacterized protein n=1 Tax=Mauremys mutica TaxID=74926 RepID=A0A9D4AU11_9SAUR|nr:hypothetical protein KIL84_021011 [Mauremys mutica]
MGLDNQDPVSFKPSPPHSTVLGIQCAACSCRRARSRGKEEALSIADQVNPSLPIFLLVAISTVGLLKRTAEPAAEETTPTSFASRWDNLLPRNGPVGFITWGHAPNLSPPPLHLPCCGFSGGAKWVAGDCVSPSPPPAPSFHTVHLFGRVWKPGRASEGPRGKGLRGKKEQKTVGKQNTEQS